jgi:protein-S-isoprenylcysteine O-methyltransferase Ste14
MVAQLISRTAVLFAVMALLLFVPAGTIAWPAAWVFLVETTGLSLAIGLWLARHDPGLLAERLSGVMPPGQERWDRLVMATFLVLTAVWLPVMAIDAMRYRYSHVPLWVQGLGALGVFLGLYMSYLTFRANSYAAPVVKIQAARGHRVATGGPYRFVRHPMYAGAILLFVGAPLLLGSWYGLALAPVLTALLAYRARMEERMLIAKLDGYADYAARVRYRLIPFVW